jgi:hypothetical protein
MKAQLNITMRKGMKLSSKRRVGVLVSIVMTASGCVLSGVAFAMKLPVPGNLICFIIGPILFFYGIWIMLNKGGKLGNRYYDNGMLKSEAIYSNFRQIVMVKSYYNTGILKSEVPYTGKKLDGTKKEYDENGKLRQETFFVNGNLRGEKKYDENGNEIN